MKIKGWLFQPRARAMQWDTGELRWNNLTMRDMQQFLPNLYSFIYILMVLKVKEKAKQPPIKIKSYPQVSLKLNQEILNRFWK